METLKVRGMRCQHCVQSVTKALENIPNVTDVQVDLQAEEARFETTGEVDMDEIRKTVTDIGFEPA